MEGNIVNKFIKTIKNKINTNNKENIDTLNYVFSSEEISSLTKQNQEKINELKKNPLKKENKKEEPKEEIQEKRELEKTEDKIIEENYITEEKEIIEEDKQEENQNLINELPQTENNNLSQPEIIKKPTNSFIDLTEENQKLISDSWDTIDTTKLDEYILKGKDILAHNYTITYGDDALKFIIKVREEYNILISYFIGFNNEKKGIFNKTTFSDKFDTEWRYLSNYIKILEKIRGVKK